MQKDVKCNDAEWVNFQISSSEEGSCKPKRGRERSSSVSNFSASMCEFETLTRVKRKAVSRSTSRGSKESFKSGDYQSCLSLSSSNTLEPKIFKNYGEDLDFMP